MRYKTYTITPRRTGSDQLDSFTINLLVACLNKMGFTVVRYNTGHVKDQEKPYPWVEIQGTQENLRRLNYALMQENWLNTKSVVSIQPWEMVICGNFATLQPTNKNMERCWDTQAKAMFAICLCVQNWQTWYINTKYMLPEFLNPKIFSGYSLKT